MPKSKKKTTTSRSKKSSTQAVLYSTNRPMWYWLLIYLVAGLLLYLLFYSLFMKDATPTYGSSEAANMDSYRITPQYTAPMNPHTGEHY